MNYWGFSSQKVYLDRSVKNEEIHGGVKQPLFGGLTNRLVTFIKTIGKRNYESEKRPVRAKAR